MSVFSQSGVLGVAYYDLDTSTVYLMPDKADNSDFTLLEQGRTLVQVIRWFIIKITNSNIYNMFTLIFLKILTLLARIFLKYYYCLLLLPL